MAREGVGIVYGILTACVVASIAVLVKLSAEVPSEVLVFCRNFIGFLFFLPIGLLKKEPINFTLCKRNFLRAFMGLLALYCYFFALKKLELVDAILLLNTIPLFVPFVVWIWLKKRIAMPRVLALLVGFAGVIFVLNPDRGLFQLSSLVALGTGLFGAIAFVGVRELTKVQDSLSIVIYYFIISTPISFFPLLFAWQKIQDNRVWWYVLGIGLLGILYQLFLTESYRHLAASKASSMLYLAVILGGFFDWLFWGRIPDLFDVIGAILVIAAGIFILLHQQPGTHLKR